MAHPLETIIREADGFLLIGDSSKGRFPAQSFYNYVTFKRHFYCVDLGGLKESRGGAAGVKVYGSAAELPDTVGDLAIVWVTQSRLRDAIDLAVTAGCKRIWFSFRSSEPESVDYAVEQGLEVVEIGRCPVHYMGEMTGACKAHTLMFKISGSYRKPPQTDPRAKRRELL